MPLPELRVSFADRAELEEELAANLRHGRAFVKDAEGVAVLSDCVLRLVHPEDGAELAVSAQAVLICDAGPARGIGLQLRPFDAAVIARLEGFVAGEREATDAPEPAADAPEDVPEPAEGAPEDVPEPAEGAPEDAPEPPVEAAPDAAAECAKDAGAQDAASDGAVPGAAAQEDEEQAVEAGEGSEGEDQAALELSPDLQAQPARHERLRKLSQTEQQKIARTGDLPDRVMLERIYGKAVWEGLLHNPKLTVPEVARIARKGTMPRPLLEVIVENNTWIQAPIVRRALLGNPRVSSEAIFKLLRITPKHELRAIYKTTTYSAQVRECARKVLEA